MPSKKPTFESIRPSGTPKGLPKQPDLFWRSSTDLSSLGPPSDVDSIATLKRLGLLPFSGSSFPLMGFLATLYEHVSTAACEALAGRKMPVDDGQLGANSFES